MIYLGSKYSTAGKLAAIFVLLVLITPTLMALADTDGCCDESTCCDYTSCDCNCHSTAGLVSIPEFSPRVGKTSFVASSSAALPTEDHPRSTDRPPRLTA